MDIDHIIDHISDNYNESIINICTELIFTEEKMQQIIEQFLNKKSVKTISNETGIRLDVIKIIAKISKRLLMSTSSNPELQKYIKENFVHSFKEVVKKKTT